ncbi:hypothetical protein LSAT2_004671, partial [Lamellibrachia satsuma]
MTIASLPDSLELSTMTYNECFHIIGKLLSSRLCQQEKEAIILHNNRFHCMCETVRTKTLPAARSFPQNKDTSNTTSNTNITKQGYFKHHDCLHRTKKLPTPQLFPQNKEK